MAKISIIIPVLNEAAVIGRNLLCLQDGSDIEIIVVDGGSQDNTLELAKATGVKVISCPISGRANQMNLGAVEATGNILLFLHADTLLPKGYQAIVEETLAKPETIAGAFQLSINGKKPLLRLVEKMVNWRSHFFSLPYGDQAIFCQAYVFEKIGGFPNLPIMEDFELIRQLKNRGKISIAPLSVITSSRRWDKLGIVKTTIINQLIIIGYFLGIPPIQLKDLYRRF